MNIRIFPVMLLSLLGSAPIWAQELKENINVEGLYRPDIIRQERLAAFPATPEIKFETFDMKYDEEGRPVQFAETLQPMPATLWGASRFVPDARGYVVAGAGSYLNSELSAGYRFISTEQSTLGARLQFNSSSLFRPWSDGACAGNPARRYDGSFGLYGSHSFADFGRLDAAATYSLSRFNYYGYNPGGSDLQFPWQTLNGLNINAQWTSEATAALPWHALAGIGYTGFNSLYIPDSSRRSLERFPGQREADIFLGGGFFKPWADGSRLGIDARLDILLYTGSAHKSDILAETISPLPKADDYAMLNLNPHYSFTRGLLNVRVGAQLDLAFSAGPHGARYSFFHAAPDIRFDWRKQSVGLFLHLLGGSELQTLAAQRAADYYCIPGLTSTRPVYSPLDASAGIALGPFAGFTATLSAAYKTANRVPLGGMYSYFLSSPLNPAGGPWLATRDGGMLSADNCLSVKGWSFAAQLEYTAGEIFSISAAGTYQNQNGGKGYFNGFDRPRWTADAKATVKPVKGLSVSLGWGLRAVRKVYWLEPAVADGSATPHALRLKDWQSLNASASYAFTPALSIWLQADNITARRNILLPDLPSQRFSIMGGLSFTF